LAAICIIAAMLATILIFNVDQCKRSVWKMLSAKYRGDPASSLERGPEQTHKRTNEWKRVPV
jgi:hypothetical protein